MPRTPLLRRIAGLARLADRSRAAGMPADELPDGAVESGARAAREDEVAAVLLRAVP